MPRDYLYMRIYALTRDRMPHALRLAALDSRRRVFKPAGPRIGAHRCGMHPSLSRLARALARIEAACTRLWHGIRTLQCAPIEGISQVNLLYFLGLIFKMVLTQFLSLTVVRVPPCRPQQLPTWVPAHHHLHHQRLSTQVVTVAPTSRRLSHRRSSGRRAAA